MHTPADVLLDTVPPYLTPTEDSYVDWIHMSRSIMVAVNWPKRNQRKVAHTATHQPTAVS